MAPLTDWFILQKVQHPIMFSTFSDNSGFYAWVMLSSMNWGNVQIKTGLPANPFHFRGREPGNVGTSHQTCPSTTLLMETRDK